MKNINIERTIIEFGYDPLKLKPNSCKPVYRICDICQTEDIKSFQSVNIAKQIKCLKCSNKINANTNKKIRSEKISKRLKQNGHPRQGKRHSEESRRKISTKHKENKRFYSKEEKEKLSKRMSGKNNPFYGKKHNNKTREKMSLAAKARAKTGKDSILYGKSYFAKYVEYQKANGSIIKLRSSWEVKVAKYLDAKSIKWDYELKAFPVIYEYDNKQIYGTYIPDFFLDNGEVWEVKGYWRKDALAKFEAFLSQYPEVKIKLLQKAELQKLKIL